MLKQQKLVNELLVPWKNHKQNCVFTLINKILLLQYSKRIFSVDKRAFILKLTHKPELIKLPLKDLNFSRNSSLSLRYKHMNI